MDPAVVLFDENCTLCRQLAALAGRRSGGAVAFHSWQSFVADAVQRQRLPEASRGWSASELRVLCDAQLLEGLAAWAFLVERHPDLAGLNWLARRLGLVREAAAALRGTASLLRSLCRRCPREARSSR